MIKFDTVGQQLPDFNMNKLIIKVNKNISDKPVIEPARANSDTQRVQPDLQVREEPMFEVY